MEDSKQPVPGLHISGAIEGYVAAVNPTHPAADSSSGQLVSSHADHLPDRWSVHARAEGHHLADTVSEQRPAPRRFASDCPVQPIAVISS